jgi:fatty-acyl-CoA synthase
MPPALMDMPHLRVDGSPVTPREALSELEQGTVKGQRIVRIIEEQGVSVLTRPNEARFQK